MTSAEQLPGANQDRLDAQVDASLDAQGVPVEPDDEQLNKIIEAINKHRHDFSEATQNLGKIPNTQPYSQLTTLDAAKIIQRAIKAGVKWDRK